MTGHMAKPETKHCIKIVIITVFTFFFNPDFYSCIMKCLPSTMSFDADD